MGEGIDAWVCEGLTGPRRLPTRAQPATRVRPEAVSKAAVLARDANLEEEIWRCFRSASVAARSRSLSATKAAFVMVMGFF